MTTQQRLSQSFLDENNNYSMPKDLSSYSLAIQELGEVDLSQENAIEQLQRYTREFNDNPNPSDVEIEKMHIIRD
jgi:hypothetical protein